jgi:hypothetical protein
MIDITRFLQQKNLISPTMANRLGEFVDFHDSLMNNRSLRGLEKANAKAKELLQFLCVECGVNLNEELESRTFEEIATLRTEQFSDNEKYEITETDFDNLDRLYKKCPCIQKEIEKKLTVPLRGAELSGFTPNTGGILIPFTSHKKSDSTRPIGRANIGVAFTPNDIRIGLNFGSQAHKYRVKYYDLLLNGELIGNFELLSRKASGYCLCDTFWHYYIRNVQSLQWCLALYGSTKVAIERAIEETKHLEGTPLIANKYLISKVINRRPEDFAYILNGLVCEISKTLDELYPILERIEEKS